MIDRRTPGCVPGFAAQAREGAGPLVFVHMSDPHIGHHDLAEATFARALEGVENLAQRPDFILITGDLTEGEPAHYRAFRRLASLTSIPVRVLPGNHDVGNRLSDRSLPLLDRYRSQIGPDYYAFAAGPGKGDSPPHGVMPFDRLRAPSGVEGGTVPLSSRFFLLNSLFLRSPSKVFPRDSWRVEAEVEAQWEFLRRELLLSTAPARPAKSVFIGFHHLPYAVHMRGPAGGYLPISRAARRRILALCEEFHVQAILSGHAHWSREGRHNGTALITTPSVSFNSPFGPGGQLPLGYRVIAVHGDHLAWRYKSLDMAGLEPVSVIGLRQHQSDGRYLDGHSGRHANTRLLAASA